MEKELVDRINKLLKDNYGTLTDNNLPLFRVIWSTNVTEKRFGEFTDFIDEFAVRTVREVREVLKYPFCQDRYILERIKPISAEARAMGLVNGNYSYEEVYTFQDRLGQYLPLREDKVIEALFLYFEFFVKLSHSQRTDIRMQMLAEREIARKEAIRQKIGEGMRSPFYLGVIE